MADFVAVLKKTIDGLGDDTPAMRERVYEKARTTVAAKLAAINPPPPAAVAERQKKSLEDAIGKSRRNTLPVRLAADPLDELENVFSDARWLASRSRRRPPARRAAASRSSRSRPQHLPRMWQRHLR